MIMWVMSDRAIPRSFRMMEGFGVHTFALSTNAASAFCKVSLETAAGLHRCLGRSAEDSGKDRIFTGETFGSH